MIKSGSKYMKVKVDTETGQVVKIVDEKEDKATSVSPEEFEEIYQSRTGFRHVATVFHAHRSPGCVYFRVGGRAYRICR